MKHLILFENFNMSNNISVNIWDDYKQIPEYDVNDDTKLYIEESDYPKDMINHIIKKIYDYIQDNIKIEDVKYEIISKEYTREDNNGVGKTERRDIIQISNLDKKKREELLEKLKNSGLKVAGTILDFYSGS